MGAVTLITGSGETGSRSRRRLPSGDCAKCSAKESPRWYTVKQCEACYESGFRPGTAPGTVMKSSGQCPNSGCEAKEENSTKTARCQGGKCSACGGLWDSETNSEYAFVVGEN